MRVWAVCVGCVCVIQYPSRKFQLLRKCRKSERGQGYGRQEGGEEICRKYRRGGGMRGIRGKRNDGERNEGVRNDGERKEGGEE